MQNRIKLTKNFYLDEFVDPRTYFKTHAGGFILVDSNIINIAQRLREYYGSSISINNWWKYYQENSAKIDIDQIIDNIEALNRKGKLNIWSGYRSPKCNIGANKSAHRFGMAIDPKGDEVKFFKIIKDNRAEFYNLGVRRLEDISITKGWLHIDTLERNTKPNSIRVVNLTKSTETIYI